MPIAKNDQDLTELRTSGTLVLDISKPAVTLDKSLFAGQAKKRFPQLAEHAARMKCGSMPPGSLTQFMHTMMKTKTAPNYDNVIATSSFYDEDDDDVSETEPVSAAFFQYQQMRLSLIFSI